VALVVDHYLLTLQLKDGNGNESTREFELRTTVAATAATDTATIIAAFEGVSNAEIVGYILGAHFIEDTITLPTAGQPVTEVAQVTTLISGAGNKKADYTIPMPKGTIMAGNNLITTAALVTTFHGLYITAGVAYLSDGEIAAVGPLKGVRTTRKRRFNR